MVNKVVLVGTTGASFYGFRADLIRHCIEQGEVVYAFTSEYTDECLQKIQALGAIPVPYKLSRGGLNPVVDLLSLYQLIQKIKTIRPDVVFSFFAKPVIYGTLAASLARVPRIIGMLEGLGYTFTEQPEGYSQKTLLIRKIQTLLYQIALPRLDELILLNPDDKQDLLAACNIRVKSCHILGGIGLNLKDYQYSPVKNDNINFLFIGRLLKEKGVFEFIEAIKLVKNRYPEATFTVLGAIDPHNLGALTQQQLDELIAHDIFEYPGHVSDVKPWINRCSVFVLPSYREGVPRSTQEAMAIGRPVITTDVPGCRETVIDGVNGFLVPKWDPEALAEKMIYFINHPEQINVMGQQSYRMAVEHFDANMVNQKLYKILGF